TERELPMPPHRNAYRPVVMGTRGVVTSAHPLASMAGIRMLVAGGNAADAAVATAAALTVVEPFMSGPGWHGLALVARGASAAAVLAPAIEYAERGVPLTVKGTDFFEEGRAKLARSAEAQRLYLGATPRPGAVVRYPDLASTLRQVAEGGAEALYRGPIARSI